MVMNKQIQILAASSTGGHWIQLQRFAYLFEKYSTVYLCTAPKVLNNSKFFLVREASRWNKFNLILQFIQVSWIVFHLKPKVIISTGASVGIWAIIAGRFIGSKTIWLDSIANYNTISLSGRLAKPFCSIFLTQWKHLESESISFKGNVL